MFEPPNFSRTLTFQKTFPLFASSTLRSPLAPNAYTRPASIVGVAARAVAPIVAEPAAVRRLPDLLAGRGVERDDVLLVAARAERVEPAAGGRKRRVAVAGPRRLPRKRRAAGWPGLQQPCFRRTPVAVRPAPLGPVVESAVGDRGRQGQHECQRVTSGRTPSYSRCFISNLRFQSLDARIEDSVWAVDPTSGSLATEFYLFETRTDFRSTRDTGVSPFTAACSIASTTAIPSTTRPKTVYLLSSDGASPVTMKNDVVALAGSSPRAIDRIPFTCFDVVELRLQRSDQLLLLLGQRHRAC